MAVAAGNAGGPLEGIRPLGASFSLAPVATAPALPPAVESLAAGRSRLGGEWVDDGVMRASWEGGGTAVGGRVESGGMMRSPAPDEGRPALLPRGVLPDELPPVRPGEPVPIGVSRGVR
jgi:hypothetical protein